MYCKGKVVDEDIKSRYIIRCEKCGTVYEGVTSLSLGPICKGESMSEGLERVYYYRDSSLAKKRMVTVVIIHLGDEWARGMAICSEKDNFNKKIGRAIARGRATAALLEQESGSPVYRGEAVQIIARACPQLLPERSMWMGLIKKSEYMPELTEYEKVILRVGGAEVTSFGMTRSNE